MCSPTFVTALVHWWTGHCYNHTIHTYVQHWLEAEKPCTMLNLSSCLWAAICVHMADTADSCPVNHPTAWQVALVMLWDDSLVHVPTAMCMAGGSAVVTFWPIYQSVIPFSHWQKMFNSLHHKTPSILTEVTKPCTGLSSLSGLWQLDVYMTDAHHRVVAHLHITLGGCHAVGLVWVWQEQKCCILVLYVFSLTCGS